MRWPQVLACALLIPFFINAQSASLSGELKTWHKVTLTFDGPNTSETASDNPFADYALQVTFTNGGRKYVVPGYYAADGNAAESSATSGNKWKVHFAPDLTGQWSWSASFRKGKDVAVNGGGGSAGYFDGRTGSFSVSATDKTGRDHRGKGRLNYVGQHYLQYAGTKEWFVKAGADAPENTLAYEDFDAVPNVNGRRKSWAPHAQDYRAAEAAPYTWKNGKGSELLGVITYLSGKGVNAFSFLTFNILGDDKNVFPHLLRTSVDGYGGSDAWTNDVYHDRFDVSRLAQWEQVFSFADLKGMYLHFKTQETENNRLMDGGNVGRERKLYYRELIARFGHHLALNWNMGEENTQSVSQRRDMAAYFAATDPYQHHRVIHTYPVQDVYGDLLGGQSAYTGASVQTENNYNTDNFTTTLKWVQQSAATGKKWVVAVDEPGSSTIGVDADPKDRKNTRTNVVWPVFMAGGAGTEFYYGYGSGCGDLDCQDHRTRDEKYTDAAIALGFFQKHFQKYLPSVTNRNGVTSSTDDYVLANPGTAYAVYRPNGGSTGLNLPSGNWQVQWYNPRTGALGSAANLGGTLTAPSNDDWAALITVAGGTPPPPPPPAPEPEPEPEPEPTPQPNTVFLEAECATYGSAWKPLTKTGASNDVVLVADNATPFYNDPPSSSSNIIRFNFTASQAGKYRMFVRTSSKNDDDNSIWFRVAGGTWYRWNGINNPDRSDRFAWLRVGETTSLQSFNPLEWTLGAGSHTVEIATRESGLQLDKVAIGLLAPQPTGLGGTAKNCDGSIVEPDQPAGPTSTTFFEAECATYGSAWEPLQRSSASGGVTLVAPGSERFIDSPPTDDRYFIRMPVTVATAGKYRIFVRSLTTNPGDDSMWIRVGGGKWIQWNLVNAPYPSSDPVWAQAGEWTSGISATPVEFTLTAGNHVIEIARRESGIEIDKVAIGLLAEQPTGTGQAAANCNNAAAQTAGSFPARNFEGSTQASVSPSVYPNPVGDRFNLTFSGELRSLDVFDAQGRRVLDLTPAAVDQFSFDRGNLRPGVYLLKLGLEEGLETVRVVVH